MKQVAGPEIGAILEVEPAPRRTETSYTRVAERLRQEVITGSILPGSWLRMTALAEKYGVSVQPVREALQQLEGEGLLEMFPNRGARVKTIDRGRLIHIYEIRQALESFLCRQFAEEASLSDIRHLETLQGHHDKAIASGDRGLIMRANKAFHLFINGRGGNREAIDLITRHYGLSQMLRARYGFDEGYWDRVLRQHHALLEAIRARQPSDAADIGAAHVRHTMLDLLQRLDLAGI